MTLKRDMAEERRRHKDVLISTTKNKIKSFHHTCAQRDEVTFGEC